MNKHEILNLLENDQVSYDDAFSVIQSVGKLLQTEDITEVRDVVIRLLDGSHKFPENFATIIVDLAESVGLYPYVGKVTGSALVRKEAHKSRYLENLYLHEDQRVVSDKLMEKSVILSAPTSYGKSLLIKEMIASNKYANIVVIQPTLALLDETRKSLNEFRDKYNLVLTTTEEPGERNIFLFTAERAAEYEHFSSVDFFVIDEFYKLSGLRGDERYVALNIALYKLLSYTNHFYFLGPHIYKIDEGFSEINNAEWVRSHFATVAVDIDTLVGPRGGSLTAAKKKEELFKLLDSFKNPTLIYCSKRNRVSNLAVDYFEYINKSNLIPSVDEDISNIQEWIDENVHMEWSLRDMLDTGIAFHHGSIPRHLGSSIVNLFNAGKIKYLFCTSTLIEGVNTSAENVVLYDHSKGNEPLDYFDFKNIAGRSGRMNKHFVGKVFQFETVPEEEDIIVDIPVYSQKNAALEILVQMRDDDLKPESKVRLSTFNTLSNEEKVVIRRNTSAPVLEQIRLITELKNNRELLQKLCITKIGFNDLLQVIEVCFEYLRPLNDNGGSYTDRQMAYFLSLYIQHKNVGLLIKNEYQRAIEKGEEPRIQTIIETKLHLIRNWFGYKLPKMLIVLKSIIELIDEDANTNTYARLIDHLESEFVYKNLSFLREYGVPNSALRKLHRIIAQDFDREQIIKTIRNTNLASIGLLAYEVQKVDSAIGS
jgi:hypothetical protein